MCSCFSNKVSKRYWTNLQLSIWDNWNVSFHTPANKNLSADWLFFPLYFHQFLCILEWPFWKTHFQALVLLVARRARPSPLGTVGWFISSSVWEGDSSFALTLKWRQFNLIAKHKAEQSNLHRNRADFVLNLVLSSEKLTSKALNKG